MIRHVLAIGLVCNTIGDHDRKSACLTMGPAIREAIEIVISDQVGVGPRQVIAIEECVPHHGTRDQQGDRD